MAELAFWTISLKKFLSLDTRWSQSKISRENFDAIVLIRTVSGVADHGADDFEPDRRNNMEFCYY